MILTPPQVTVTAYSSNGQAIPMVDPAGAQAAISNAFDNFREVETDIRTLRNRIDELEAFIRWCGKHHQEVMDEFTVTQAAKARIHHTEKA